MIDRDVSSHIGPLPQEDAIADIVKVMKQEEKAHPQTLFIVGSYRIGKERAYLGAAKALGWKVHVNADKLRVSPDSPIQVTIMGLWDCATRRQLWHHKVIKFPPLVSHWFREDATIYYRAHIPTSFVGVGYMYVPCKCHGQIMTQSACR